MGLVEDTLKEVSEGMILPLYRFLVINKPRLFKHGPIGVIVLINYADVLDECIDTLEFVAIDKGAGVQVFNQSWVAPVDWYDIGLCCLRKFFCQVAGC